MQRKEIEKVYIKKINELKKLSLIARLRNYFITGIIVLVPLGFTLYLTIFLVSISSKFCLIVEINFPLSFIVSPKPLSLIILSKLAAGSKPVNIFR